MQKFYAAVDAFTEKNEANAATLWCRKYVTSEQQSALQRDFSKLLLLAAGTMTDTNGAANFTQQFAVNGQPAQLVETPLWRFGGGRYVVTDVRLSRIGPP